MFDRSAIRHVETQEFSRRTPRCRRRHDNRRRKVGRQPGRLILECNERPAIPGSKFSFAFRVGNAGSSQGAMQERITLVSKSRPAIAIPKRCFVFLRGSTPSIWRLACERRQLHFHTRCGLLRRAGVVATSHPRCSDFRGVLWIHGLVCGLALLIWGQTCPCTSSAKKPDSC